MKQPSPMFVRPLRFIRLPVGRRAKMPSSHQRSVCFLFFGRFRRVHELLTCSVRRLSVAAEIDNVGTTFELFNGPSSSY